MRLYWDSLSHEPSHDQRLHYKISNTHAVMSASAYEDSAPMLRRQERHNEGTLTALMSTETLVQQDGCDNHTHEGKPARAYNITQCRRHCLLAQPLLPRK